MTRGNVSIVAGVRPDGNAGLCLAEPGVHPRAAVSPVVDTNRKLEADRVPAAGARLLRRVAVRPVRAVSAGVFPADGGAADVSRQPYEQPEAVRPLCRLVPQLVPTQ